MTFQRGQNHTFDKARISEKLLVLTLFEKSNYFDGTIFNREVPQFDVPSLINTSHRVVKNLIRPV